MVPKGHIEKILAKAVQAPSGDNAQPWRFEAGGDAINVYNIPGKDYSPYNFRERGSYFADGALIENIIIAASALGYAVEQKLVSGAGDENLVARLTLSQNKISADALFASIEKRTTNRKPYSKRPLRPEHKSQILGAFESAGFGELRILEEPVQIKKFAELVSLSDQLIFEEKSIHDAIFNSIRWTKEAEEEKRGMYIKTLELPPPARILFKMLKNWPTLAFLNHLGISRLIASQSAKGYASSSAIGIITMPDDANESYVKAGRAFERLWLTAARLDVSLQPVTALAYLAERVAAGDAAELSQNHAEKIITAKNRILGLFGEPSGVIAMMFRMGYANAPSARSRKSEANIIYND